MNQLNQESSFQFGVKVDSSKEEETFKEFNEPIAEKSEQSLGHDKNSIKSIVKKQNASKKQSVVNKVTIKDIKLQPSFNLQSVASTEGKKNSEYNTSDNQNEEFNKNILVSTHDNETNQDDTSRLFLHSKGEPVIQDLAESLNSGNQVVPAQFTRNIQTACFSPKVGVLKRRNHLKASVIPNLTGTLGGDNVQKNLRDFDNFLDSHENQQVFPSISKRSTSIPPKTAGSSEPLNLNSVRPFVNKAKQSVSPASSIRVDGRYQGNTNASRALNKKLNVKLPSTTSTGRPFSIDQQQRSVTALLNVEIESQITVPV